MRRQPKCSTLLGAALAALVLGGCALTGTIDLAPTIDTSGNAGFEVRLSGGYGNTLGDGSLIARGTIGAGVGGPEAQPVVVGGLEWALVISEGTGLGYDLAIGYAHRQFIGPSGSVHRPGFVARVAVLYDTINGVCRSKWNCTRVHAGVGLRAEILGGPDALGVLSIPISLGVLRTTTLFF